MIVSPKVQLQSEEKEHLSLKFLQCQGCFFFFFFRSCTQPLIFLSSSIDFFHPSTWTAWTFLCFSSRSFFVITCCHSCPALSHSPAVTLMVTMIVALSRVELWMSAAAIGRSAAAEWQWNDPAHLWQLVLSNQTAVDYSVYIWLFGGHQRSRWLTIIWQNRQ